jgi:hypothetical protein
MEYIKAWMEAKLESHGFSLHQTIHRSSIRIDIVFAGTLAPPGS